MPKLVKQKVYNKNGEAKISCYHANISKEILSKTNIKDSDNIIVYAENNKIIIEKK